MKDTKCSKEDFCLIIIDDGLLDDVRWKKSWKFITEPDHGMYEAINKGIRMATGDIIGLVHSDDFLYDSHVISDVVSLFLPVLWGVRHVC